ncbi:hypothetical protein Fmac_005205 [Flemingia macrophylla]|uniref:Uncharacterized protein n=1 Tax=Flemingia macrophylla TaxID=520843 RepID=A0ABD1N727_9FABA
MELHVINVRVNFGTLYKFKKNLTNCTPRPPPSPAASPVFNACTSPPTPSFPKRHLRHLSHSFRASNPSLPCLDPCDRAVHSAHDLLRAIPAIEAFLLHSCSPEHPKGVTRLNAPLLSNLRQTTALSSKVRAGRGGHQPGGGFHQR